MDFRELIKQHVDLAIAVIGILAIGTPLYLGLAQDVARLDERTAALRGGRAVQSGVVEFQALQAGGEGRFTEDTRVNTGDRAVRGWRVARQRVALDPQKCAETPAVIVALSGIDVGSKRGYPTIDSPNPEFPNAVPIRPENVGNVRVLVEAVDVSDEGFTITIQEWADTSIFLARVSWLASCQST